MPCIFLLLVTSSLLICTVHPILIVSVNSLGLVLFVCIWCNKDKVFLILATPVDGLVPWSARASAGRLMVRFVSHTAQLHGVGIWTLSPKNRQSRGLDILPHRTWIVRFWIDIKQLILARRAMCLLWIIWAAIYRESHVSGYVRNTIALIN